MKAQKTAALAIAQDLPAAFVPPQCEEFFEPAQVIEALHQARGILSRAAALLGCSRRTVANYCERYPEVLQARAEGREMLLDAAEGGLSEGVDRGDDWAVRYALSTIGKGRGYVYPTSGKMTMIETNGQGAIRVVQIEDAPADGLGADDLVSAMKQLVAAEQE